MTYFNQIRKNVTDIMQSLPSGVLPDNALELIRKVYTLRKKIDYDERF